MVVIIMLKIIWKIVNEWLLVFDYEKMDKFTVIVKIIIPMEFTFHI